MPRCRVLEPRYAGTCGALAPRSIRSSDGDDQAGICDGHAAQLLRGDDLTVAFTNPCLDPPDPD